MSWDGKFYMTTCRTCSVEFQAHRKVRPGIISCPRCRHSGLRGWLLAPVFLLIRIVEYGRAILKSPPGESP